MEREPYNGMNIQNPKRLFNLYDNDKLNQNGKNLIRVQKRVYSNNICESKEEINNLRAKSLENRTRNKKYKSFSKTTKNNKNNNNGSKGRNISDLIKIDNSTNKKNNYKKDMIKWLNSWEKRNTIINKSLNIDKMKRIYTVINRILSNNYKRNGKVFFTKLKNITHLCILQKYFSYYKNITEVKKILEELKRNQQTKISEEKNIKEKIIILKKLMLKYLYIRRFFIKWKKINKGNNKYIEEKILKLNSSDDYITNEDTSDYFNKSQPEISSFKINNYNFFKNKYNIQDIKSAKDKNNNNINININYNLITNNNSLEQGIYKKKKINIPKIKNYQNKSCVIEENDQEDNDNNNERKDFMNNSMIIRRIKIKKKENEIYFPKHIKQNYIQNNFDYLTYKKNMQVDTNMQKKGIINKRINLKFQKILGYKSNF